MHGMNIKYLNSAGTCFGEADNEGEKFKYPGVLKTLLRINRVYLAGSITTELINYTQFAEGVMQTTNAVVLSSA
jgi:hypothetical protein